jgi:hypothetical protein
LSAEQKKLVSVAKENPWMMFTAEDLAKILGTSLDYVLAAKKGGAKFPGRKSRPEWVQEWLYANPGMQIKS